MNLQPTTVSAPGKLMLFGEHAVVYGHPCLAASVDRSVTVRVSAALCHDEFHTPGVADARFVANAITAFRAQHPVSGYISVETKSELQGYGLGSSAAVTVALIAALATAFGASMDRRRLFDLAYSSVRTVQGTASGFDVAVSIWGGTIAFDGNTKQVEALDCGRLPVVVGFSGRKKGTVDMIAQVAKRHREDPDNTDRLFTLMTRETHDGRQALAEKDWKQLGTCMDKQQHLLQELGVSTEKLDAMIEAASNAGAYGAKLSGAGGGDCMIALVSEERSSAVKQAIENAGGEILQVSVGTGKGVL